MTNKNIICAVLLLVITTNILLGQNTSAEPTEFIEVQNASFTEANRYTKPFYDWYACDNIGGIRFNICPVYTLGLVERPDLEHAYVGLTVHEEGKNITIGQQLRQPLQAGNCYLWMLNMSFSSVYRAFNSYQNKVVNYNKPVKIVIWAGDEECNKKEVLATSDSIHHAGWRWHHFNLLPNEDCTHLMIEAYYADDAQKYNGNVLIDKVSPVYAVDCNTNQLLLNADSIYIHPTNDLRDLEEAIQYHGKKIRFSKEKNTQLEFQYYFRPGGELTWGEPHLYALAEYMKMFKELRLIIGVPPGAVGEESYRALVHTLNKELKYLGLWLNDFKVKRYDSLEKNWLWEPGESRLVMRLEKK